MPKKPKLDLHQRALQVFGELQPDKREKAAQRKVTSYNERRREQTVNKVKPVLIEMDAAFARGEKIGGATSLKEYCRMYKYIGNVLSYARCRQILTGKSGNEGKKVKSLDLKDGVTVTIDGKNFTIHNLNSLSPVPNATGYTHNIDINLIAIEESKKEEPLTERPKRTDYATEDADGKNRMLCGRRFSRHELAVGDATCPMCLAKRKDQENAPTPFDQKEAKKKAQKRKNKKPARKVKLFSSVDIRALDKTRDEQEHKEWKRRLQAATKRLTPLNNRLADIGARAEFSPSGYKDEEDTPEFRAEYEKASEEFNKVFDEGKAKGWISTEPREKPTVTVVLKEACSESADQ